jgi:hypothetical protein
MSSSSAKGVKRAPIKGSTAAPFSTPGTAGAITRYRKTTVSSARDALVS